MLQTLGPGYLTFCCPAEKYKCFKEILHAGITFVIFVSVLLFVKLGLCSERLPFVIDGLSLHLKNVAQVQQFAGINFALEYFFTQVFANWPHISVGLSVCMSLPD